MSEFPLEDQRATEDRHRENRARLAKAYASVDLKGGGSLEIDDAVDFGLTFIQEPFVSFGSVLDLDTLRDLLDVDDDETPTLPLVSGYVTEWVQDERDFYTGAYVACRVYWPPQPLGPDGLPVEEPDYSDAEMVAHFTFEAIAMKDIPPAAAD